MTNSITTRSRLQAALPDASLPSSIGTPAFGAGSGATHRVDAQMMEPLINRPEAYASRRAPGALNPPLPTGGRPEPVMSRLQQRIENSSGAERARYLRLQEWLQKPALALQNLVAEAGPGGFPFMSRLQERIQTTSGEEQVRYLRLLEWLHQPTGSWEDFLREKRVGSESAASEISIAAMEDSPDIPLAPLDESTYAALEKDFDEYVSRVHG